MAQQIQVGNDILEFPDNMPDDQIKMVIQKEYGSKQTNEQPNQPKINQQSNQNGYMAKNMPLDKYDAIKDKLMENILRPVARAGRTSLAGIAGISDPVNMALGMPLASESTKQLFDKYTGGFAAPRNKTEEMADTAGELFTGGMGVGKAAILAASKGGKYAQAAGKMLGVETTPQVAGLAGASIAIPVSQEATQKGLDVLNISPDSNLRPIASLTTGIGAGILGGMAGAKMTNIPVNLKNWNIKKTLPEATPILGKTKVANETIKDLQTKGISPQEIDFELKGDGGIGLDPIDVSKSNVSNIQDLAQIAASRKILQNAFDVREQRIIKAQNGILKGVDADETTLVNLSQEYKKNLLNKRRIASRPLYESGLSKGIQVPMESIIAENVNPEIQGILQTKSNNLTLQDLLRSPVIQESINSARNKSYKFSNTPAMDIYGNIHQKTKPVYETKTTSKDVVQDPIVSREQGFFQPVAKDVRLGAAATNIVPEFTTKTQIKTPAQFKVPDNDVRVLNAVDSILYDKIGELGSTGYTKEQTALKLVRDGIHKILDDDSPELKEARQIWSRDTQNILSQDKTVVGLISRLAADKYDEAATKLSRLSPTEISKAKVKLMSVDAGKYSQAVKAFTDKKISTLKEGDTIVKMLGNDLERARMRAMFPNSKTFDGFKKALTYIEKTKPVQDVLKRALDQQIKSTSLVESIPQQEGLVGKGIKAIPRAASRVLINPVTNKITSQLMLQEGITGRNIKSIDTRQAEIMAKYAFTDEGRQLYQTLAKTTNKNDIDKLMTQIYLQSGFLTSLSNTVGGTNNPSLMSDAEAKEPSLEDTKQLIKERYKKESPYYQPSDEELTRMAKLYTKKPEKKLNLLKNKYKK